MPSILIGYLQRKCALRWYSRSCQDGKFPLIKSSGHPFLKAAQSLSQQQTPTLVEALHSAGLISAAITSYKLSRVSDEKNDGVITFGAMDPSEFDADAVVVLPNVNTAGFFEAKVDAVQIDGQSLGFSNKTAILDTGTVSDMILRNDTF